MRQTALDMVYELAKQDSRVVFIGSDLGVGVLKNFKAEFPDRFFMEGISEQHVVGMAAGMAMEGKIVYVNTIATFLTRRCYEQVALDLCLHNLNVRLIANGGGLVYAPLGPTHLAIEDIAIMRALPNMTVVAPADASEMRRFIPTTLHHQGPIYIRLGKGGEPLLTRESDGFEIGKSYLLREGSDVLLVTTGVTIRHCLAAADRLAALGVQAKVLHVPTVKPFDDTGFLAAVKGVRKIVTVEEHVPSGGLGTIVAELLMAHDHAGSHTLRRVSIPDKFPERYGSQDTLLEECGISTEIVTATALK